MVSFEKLILQKADGTYTISVTYLANDHLAGVLTIAEE
jgi:hypothetical protein